MSKPIFIIGIPGAEHIQQVREATLKLEDDYHVLCFNNSDIVPTFQLFNSEELEPSDLEDIKKYINGLCHD